MYKYIYTHDHGLVLNFDTKELLDKFLSKLDQTVINKGKLEVVRV